MFVGESGCWIVVGLMSLYQSYASKKREGYQPVSTRDPSAARDDDDAASITSQDTLITRERSSGAPDGLLAGFGILLLALPAICDILGTTLMNAGLLMVAASIYQMTRGALVLFVGLFSVIFLKRKLYLFHWTSLFGVVLGVAVVGLAGYLYPDSKAQAHSMITSAMADPGADALRSLFGVTLIAGAQIFTATQFVLEEYLLERSNIDPLQVVGWEGLFGLATTLAGMIVLHFAIGMTDAGRYGPFDMVEGFRQMTENKIVLVSSLLIMVSIG